MKKFFLVALLVISASIAFAQDKYEFMTINYLADRNICISIDGTQVLYEKIEMLKQEGPSVLNTNPLLLKVKEYQDKGWEVMTFNTISLVTTDYIAYLRKKKPN